MAVLDSSLLVYVNFFRDRSTPDVLQKVALNFYSPTEMSEAKKLIVSVFNSNLDGCQFKADQRNSSVRSAKDAEVEVILGIFNLADTASALEETEFSISVLESGYTTWTIWPRGDQFACHRRSSNTNGHCPLEPNCVSGHNLA